MSTFLLVFFASFCQVALITLQSINANQKRYLLAFFTSIGISIVAVYATVHVIGDPFRFFWPYLFGNALGVIAAMKLDTKIAKKQMWGRGHVCVFFTRKPNLPDTVMCVSCGKEKLITSPQNTWKQS